MRTGQTIENLRIGSKNIDDIKYRTHRDVQSLGKLFVFVLGLYFS
ncbi:hypothetical protein GCM10022394_31100 [Zobellella aerophila]|uniref:Uncharacterized protein n=1 Tax=Zobellella aerophila TaxID=870480 RepID=A0ABP6WC93_9GAMM